MTAGRVPDPPALDGPDPLIEPWPVDRPIHHVHSVAHGATGFNPGAGAPNRFSPLRRSPGIPVPTWYGAARLEGALWESILRDVDAGFPSAAFRRARLRGRQWSVVLPKRPLELVQLHGAGLARLRLKRREIIDTWPDQYDRTVQWAEWALAKAPEADGLVWTSRRDDACLALMLFGDRIGPDGLEVIKGPLAIDEGNGYELVLEIAERANVMIIDD